MDVVPIFGAKFSAVLLSFLHSVPMLFCARKDVVKFVSTLGNSLTAFFIQMQIS